MAETPQQLYRDSSVFICLLNRDENARRAICEDILRQAQRGNVRIYTSTLTIAEVIRPRGSAFRRLTAEELTKIGQFFRHRFLRKVTLDERLALKAVELARDYTLRPNDAIHAATAIVAKVHVLQAWDRDFSAIAHLVPVEEPKMLSTQRELFPSSES